MDKSLIRINRIKKTVKNLREAYRETDTSLIDKFVDELYNDIDDLDYFEEKYKIIVSQRDGLDYVTGAKYLPDKDEYVLYFSQEALETIEQKLDKDEILNQIKAAIIHENVHRQQNQLNLKDKEFVDPNVDYEGYISQPHEIDAYAIGIADEWIRTIGRENAIEKLRISNFNDLSEDTRYLISDYRKLGINIYNKLLREIYNYLYREPSTYHTDPLEIKSSLRRKIMERKENGNKNF